MGKIFCLMGKSSSGKDTVFKLLKEDVELKLKPIRPYTTRPKRSNETDGIEYFFISENTLRAFEEAGKIIEMREYTTVKGVWYYATIDDGQVHLESDNYILISTLEAYRGIQEYFKPENVVPVYINADDASRLERALKREKAEKTPNYSEICRRFLADNDDFSPDKLKENKIEKFYLNTNLGECVKQIKQDMLQLF